MLITFNILKVAQASAVLLKQEPGRRMSRLRLLKLLYIADRESLQESARPITGDNPVAMRNGPVLSQTYDLIKGADVGVAEWDQYLRSVGRDVELVADPGVGKLSRREVAKLQEVAARFFQFDDWDVAECTHTFEEWEKNKPQGGGSNAIPLDDLLDATGQAAKKDALLETQRAEQIADRFFSTPPRQ